MPKHPRTTVFAAGLAMLALGVGLSPFANMHSIVSSAAQAQGQSERTLTQEELKAAREMTPEQRMTMINQMVDGLAQRLKENGKDLNGWFRLMRSYMVLGKPDAARKALADARKAFDGNGEALGQIDAFAKTLGL